MSENKTFTDYVVVPVDKISQDALFELITEFILREGTDYGTKEYTLIEKHSQIVKQLQSGEVLLVFDLNEQSPSLVKKNQLKTEL